MYSDLPAVSGIIAGSWNYSKGYYGAWNQSQDGIGSLSLSEKQVGAVNLAGLYSDLPQQPGVIAGSWNYSKGYYGAWNQSQDSIGSLSMSETSIGAVATSGQVYSADQLGQLDPAGFHAAAAGAVPGTCSVSQTGPGVLAMSETGIGLIGTTGPVYAEQNLAQLDAAGIHAAAAGLDTALCAAAAQGVAIEAMSTLSSSRPT